MKSVMILVFALAVVSGYVSSAAGELILVDIIGGRRNFWPRYANRVPDEPQYGNPMASEPMYNDIAGDQSYDKINPPMPQPNYAGIPPNITTTTPAPTPPPPPPVDEIARYARYIVHYTEWTSLGHISHQDRTNWFPSSRVFSMADGPWGNSTGTPYIYTSFHDGVPRDLKVDPRCSMTMSLAQTNFCKDRQLDPEDPRCSQVILTGYFIMLQNDTEEWKFAEQALFSRHPEMKSWPKSHHFFFGKLQIYNIQLVDNIGGSKYPSVTDYYNVKLTRSPVTQQRPISYEDSVESAVEAEAVQFNSFDVNMGFRLEEKLPETIDSLHPEIRKCPSRSKLLQPILERRKKREKTLFFNYALRAYR